MPAWHKLPLNFDPERLRADLGRVAEGEWVAHYNRSDYEGGWTGAALYAVGGAATNLYADPAPRQPFAPTPLLARCPYFQEVLAHVRSPLRAVRLLRLEAGARIREHRDHMLGLADGEARLHVAIATNADVDFVVAGRKLVLNVGETWYIDFSLPHRVANRGTTARVHLVIDCAANDWLRGLLPPDSVAPGLTEVAATPAGGPPGPEADLEAFRLLVLGEPALEEELREIGDREMFVDRVVRLASARGYAVTAGDVVEAMRAGRRAVQEGVVV